MKFVYLLPFTYFIDTRLRTGNVVFHAIVEWGAAVVIVLTIGSVDSVQALIIAGLSYLAFISLYEIGYLYNDLFAVRKEIDGRMRGPQGSSGAWISAWVVSRLIVFMVVTNLVSNQVATREWWSFFGALCIVFMLHNAINDREFKITSFLWLAWFRFMAPVIFVVNDEQRFGVALAVAMVYVIFRLLGYMDSKSLLRMPGRQRQGLRLFFFVIPLAGALALWPYGEAQGFLILTGYFAFVACAGTVASAVISNTRDKTQG